ncbi:MAG: amino acid adenylation domain-containing protein [Ferruginibacter sp.]
MKLFLNLKNAILSGEDCNAFHTGNVYYSYAVLAQRISDIRKVVATVPEAEKNIGLVANNDIETYAAIIALWLEGKAYVPLNPDFPESRNLAVLDQAFIQTIIDSSTAPLFPGYQIIHSCNIPKQPGIDLDPVTVADSEIAYILFTSGTTGKPKGVPISRKNLEGFVDAFNGLGFSLSAQDRFLQMFDLTFDLSVMSYLIPLLHGACVYTIPPQALKYSYISELMEDHHLTVALMVPSILQYLRPYFGELSFPQMRYSLFCGEALSLDITEEWAAVVPNAAIANVYGPTEDTIFCTCYHYKRNEVNKSYNGMMSIGKAMFGNIAVVLDEHHKMAAPDIPGELCLGGVQLTEGYWNDEEKNRQAFFIVNDHTNQPVKYYKTGDLCKTDEAGDIYYMGRLDHQVKVQGYRVELPEIEFHVKNYFEKLNAVVVAYKDVNNNTDLGLVIEAAESDLTGLWAYLNERLPQYMVPKKALFVDPLPLNSNGKTDRNKLTSLFSSNKA